MNAGSAIVVFATLLTGDAIFFAASDKMRPTTELGSNPCP
jgi:hypothetical protein